MYFYHLKLVKLVTALEIVILGQKGNIFENLKAGSHALHSSLLCYISVKMPQFTVGLTEYVGID